MSLCVSGLPYISKETFHLRDDADDHFSALASSRLCVFFYSRQCYILHLSGISLSTLLALIVFAAPHCSQKHHTVRHLC